MQTRHSDHHSHSTSKKNANSHIDDDDVSCVSSLSANSAKKGSFSQ